MDILAMATHFKSFKRYIFFNMCKFYSLTTFCPLKPEENCSCKAQISLHAHKHPHQVCSFFCAFVFFIIKIHLIVSKCWLLTLLIFISVLSVFVALNQEALGKENKTEKKNTGDTEHIYKSWHFSLVTTRGHCKQHNSRLGHHKIQHNTE